MTTDPVRFYLQHRAQITQWAALQERVEALVRDAVTRGDADAAIRIVRGESGDQEADFYIRNKAIICEWDQLQAQAGLALHEQLLEGGRRRGWDPSEGRGGFTEVVFRSPDFDDLRSRHTVAVLLAWTRKDLLSPRKGYPYPRLAVFLNPGVLGPEGRTALRQATRSPARSLGMTKGGEWWIHWGMLDPVTESQDLPAYAEQCLDALQQAADTLYPVLLDAIAAAKDGD